MIPALAYAVLALSGASVVWGIVTTIAWLFLLSPQIGWINSMARAGFGLEGPLFNVYTLPGMMWGEAPRPSTHIMPGRV